MTEEKLKVLRSHGVTRISINPQSMQQKTLDLIGRRHTRGRGAVLHFIWRRKEGFDNINMDLIAGLPGEETGDMKDTLREDRSAWSGQPDGPFSGSEAGGQDGTGTGISPAGKRSRDMLDAGGRDSAGEMGLSPYYLYRQKNIAGNFENTGYAKVDKAGIYNILIMEEKQSIIAAGAGASTKIVLKEPVPSPEGKGKKTNLIRHGECEGYRLRIYGGWTR